MADIIYVRCPNARCTMAWSVPQRLWEQFHVLKCTGCGGFIDRRKNSVRGAAPEPVAEPALGVTAEDIKLLGGMRIAWESKTTEGPDAG
jgi:hypothetical protein